MQHFIATYGYVAIFLLMLLESACIPVPSELIMTFGGALAAGAVPGTGLNLVGVIIAGVAGNVAGSYVAWAVGRYGGQAALRRWGRRLRMREHELDRANVWFDRYGPRAVLIGRLLPVVRTFISLPAGIAGMDPVRFGIYTTLGCIPWTAALAWAGYAVGANWHSIVDGFKGPTYVIAALVVIALAIAVWRYLRGRQAEPAHATRPATAGTNRGPCREARRAPVSVNRGQPLPRAAWPIPDQPGMTVTSPRPRASTGPRIWDASPTRIVTRWFSGTPPPPRPWPPRRSSGPGARTAAPGIVGQVLAHLLASVPATDAAVSYRSGATPTRFCTAVSRSPR